MLETYSLEMYFSYVCLCLLLKKITAFIYFVLCMCAYVKVQACHHAQVEIGEQPSLVCCSHFPLYGFQGSNSGHETERQESLPTKPSCQPY